MNTVLITRIILILVTIIMLLIIYKIQKMIQLDKRISRYSLNNNTYEDSSFFDKINHKYQKFNS